MGKKKKVVKTNAMRILDQHHITYQHSEFPWSEDHLDAITAAHNLGVEEASIYKTLVAIGNHTGPIVAVIPGNEELDLKKLAQASGNKKVEMLHLKDLEATTGYMRGGCSPIGMKKAYPTFIDKVALTKELIYISAGKRGQQIGLAPKELNQVIPSQFVDIIKIAE